MPDPSIKLRKANIKTRDITSSTTAPTHHVTGAHVRIPWSGFFHLHRTIVDLVGFLEDDLVDGVVVVEL